MPPDMQAVQNEIFQNGVQQGPQAPVEQLANSAVHRSSSQAVSPEFGQNEQAEAFMQNQQMQQGVPMLDTLSLLKLQSESTEDEVSLDTLSEEEVEKIMRSFKSCRDIAVNHYTSVVEPEIIKRRDICEATPEHYDKVFPTLSQSNRWVSRDVRTTIDWILPGLVEVFTGSDDPISVKGVSAEDDEVAKKMQQLIRYQLERKNNYHQFVTTEVKYALDENFGVAKVWWKREEERTPMRMMVDLQDDATTLSLVQSAAEGKIELTNVNEVPEAPDFLDIEYNAVELKENYPVIEYVPSSELRYTPDAPTLQECKFVAHRKIVRGDYLKRKERDGIYQDIDYALEKYNNGNTHATVLDRKNDKDRADLLKRPDDNDLASKEVELYEAYLNVDYNNDGIYEKIIVHAIGDEPIRISKNDYGLTPFFVCSAFYDPNAVFSKESFAKSLEQQQDLKTALVRQIIVNVAKNNAPRMFVNESLVDMDALMSGDEIIPTHRNPAEVVMQSTSLPLSSVSMELVQYIQNELEAQSGSTRYNQGLDSNSLNKTATGVTAIMGAAEKRNKVIARSMAENFFIPIYKFLISLNQKYLEGEQMVRLVSESFPIRKEELDIDYDLIVNVGQGAGTREAQIQYLMYTLNTVYPQLTQYGIVNAKSCYNLVTKLLEELGLRDVTQYLLDPESQEAQESAALAQQMQMQAQAQALQNSLQLSIAKSSVPRVTVDLSKLPPDVIMKYVQQHFNIQTTEQAIAEHEEFMKDD